MRARRPLFPFLLLNIFVSALVTGTIIYFYDRTHQANCNTPVAGLTAVSSEGENVSIIGVIGAGAVQDERVVIQNTGSEKIVLTGWTLSDDQGLNYAFPQSPQLTLYPGASLQVHTRAGTDQPSDVYWSLTEPAWASGELVVLYDPAHTARAFYRVP
jgi:hypothetical protein